MQFSQVLLNFMQGTTKYKISSKQIEYLHSYNYFYEFTLRSMLFVPTLSETSFSHKRFSNSFGNGLSDVCFITARIIMNPQNNPQENIVISSFILHANLENKLH
jgi:hypothetical protein